MKKPLALIYSYFSYLVGLGTILYMIGFVGDFLVPKTINSGAPGAPTQAILLNSALLILFGSQHSLMARSTFKTWWSKVLPKAFQRSTYVVLTSLVLGSVFWLWKPLPFRLWNLESTWLRILIWTLFTSGWLLVFISARMINSGHFFGLQQIKEFTQEKQLTAPGFKKPGLYRYIRHPLMLGFLLAFWATPEMTVGRMLFSLGLTIYILIALQFEERDLIHRFGVKYQRYRKQVPMLIPGLGTWKANRIKKEFFSKSSDQPSSR